MNLLPRGLWPVMLTPFDKKNELDLIALERLTEFYIATGAKGLFANCLSSEMFQLTDAERLLITKTVVEIANGRVPVISTGSFGYDVDVISSFIDKMYDTGVSAVIISTSQVSGELDSEDTFKLQMEAIIDKTGNIPLGLYECPVQFKRLLSPELMKWLAQSNRFVFHKDTSCNLSDIKKKLEAIEGSTLGFYNAHVPTGVESILSGARGLAPISANLYPELLNYLLGSLAQNGKTDQLNKLNQTLDLMDTIIHNNYPFTAKLFLKQRGLKMNAISRIPRAAMSAHDYGKIETIMKVFRQLSEELAIEVFDFKGVNE